MAKCPECKEEIDYLRHHQTGGYSQDYHGDGTIENDSFEPDGECNEFECPECNNILDLNDFKEAEYFLNGGKSISEKGIVYN